MIPESSFSNERSRSLQPDEEKLVTNRTGFYRNQHSPSAQTNRHENGIPEFVETNSGSASPTTFLRSPPPAVSPSSSSGQYHSLEMPIPSSFQKVCF